MTREPERPDELDAPPVPLDGLAREMEPTPGLEERLVAALRTEGLLRPSSGRRRLRLPAAGWALAATVAGLALFAGGFAAGQSTGTRTTLETILALQEGDPAQRAARLQRTGSLYVQAMNALDVGGPGQGGPGHEVALATLRAAVAELVRLAPDDTRLRQVLDLLEGAPSGGSSPRGDATSVLWF